MNTSDYVNEWWTDDAQDPSDLACNLAQTITVNDGESATANFHLDLGGSIEGTVFESNAVTAITIEEMFVIVFQGNDPCEHLAWIQGTGTNTTNGSYTTCGVPADTDYYVESGGNSTPFVTEWYKNPQSTPICYDAEMLTFSPGSRFNGYNFQLNDDSDQDGLADDWEILHYLSIGTVNGNTESDDDWLNAWEEFTRGTDPLDNDSDNDFITDGYEVWESQTDPNDGSDAPPLPVEGTVAHHIEVDGSFSFFDVSLGGFAGTTSDIISLSITGPGVNLTKDDLIADDNYFFNDFPRAPQYGVYTFNVTTASKSGSSSDTQSINHDLPLPIATTSYPTTNETAPTLNPYFHWELVDYPAIPLYYQCRIYNQSGNRLYRSGAVEDLGNCQIPDDILTAGETYEFQIRIYDDPVWSEYQNRSRIKIPFTVGLDKVIRGDVNGDKQIDIIDTILSLQIATGQTPSENVYSGADTTGTKAIGLPETIYTLQEVAE